MLCVCTRPDPTATPLSHKHVSTPKHNSNKRTAPQQPRKYRTRTFLAGNLDRVALRSHDQLEEGEGAGHCEEGDFECVLIGCV